GGDGGGDEMMMTAVVVASDLVAAGGMVLGGGDGCDGDDVVRVGMTMVVDLWCGSGGGWLESGRMGEEAAENFLEREEVCG
ncbi:hypothetical protein Tco_0480554, partial [Tanacetum coccineum]